MTIALAPTGPYVTSRRAPAVAVPAYGRRRVFVAGLLVGLLATCGVVAHDVLAGSGGVPASAAGAMPAPVRVVVVARPGDTLWSIAERFHGEIGFDRYLDALINLNDGPVDPGRADDHAAIVMTGGEAAPPPPRSPPARVFGVGTLAGVYCPACQADETKVVDSRVAEEGTAVRRRRQCLSCGHRFTTFERVDEVPLVVVKSDGTRRPFDRAKIAQGVAAASKGRAVDEARIDQLALAVEDEMRLDGGEVTSAQIGVAVLERLRTIDEVTYLRFASVYKDFDVAADFHREIELLSKLGASPTG